MPSGKYLAGGLQSGCTANSIGVQYKKHLRLPPHFSHTAVRRSGSDSALNFYPNPH